MVNAAIGEASIRRASSRAGRYRFGIGAKLFGAFAAVASLTLLASVDAFFSYDDIGRSLRRIEIEGVPTIDRAQILARQAAELSAISSSLTDLGDGEALAAAMNKLEQKRGELAVTLAGLKSEAIPRQALDGLQTSVDGFEQNAGRLAAFVARRIEATKTRKILVAGALAAHRGLRERLAPIVDDAGFNLIAGLQSIGENAERDDEAYSLSKKSEQQANDLRALGDLRAESNRVIGILSEVALTPSADLLPPLRDQFVASGDHARKAIDDLSDATAPESLRTSLETLLAFGTGGGGIFDVRRDELAISARARGLAAANQAGEAALAGEVQQAVDLAMRSTSSAVAASRTAILDSQSFLVVLGTISVAWAIVLAWLYVGNGLLRRLGKLNDAILALAGGDLDVVIPHEGADELNSMANAIEVFKQQAIQGRDLEIDKERGRIADLRRREASFRLLFESNPVPMWVYDLATFHFLSVNDAAVAHYGYSREQFLGMTIFDAMPAEDRNDFAQRLRIAGGVNIGEENWRHLRADGSQIDVSVYPQELQYEGRTAALAAIIDVTERKRAEARIAHMAHHDALTDLANRALFRERLNLALERRRKGLVAVLSLDLDRFKEVNDTLGHPVGDALLIAVAARLRACLREVDTVSRFGGDEFAIVQGEVADVREISALASRILEQVNRPYRLDGRDIVVSASIGVAIAPNDSDNADALLKHADIALYRVKADGRSNFRFFEREMDSQLQARREMELALRSALANREFTLHYQPLVDLQSNEVTGFEALLRWTHPQLGPIGPSEFVPLAEEAGLIASLGEWVLYEACAEAASWPTDLTVSVNLSSVQFKGRNLVAIVINALAASGLAARRLELEITESVLLQENEDNLATLRQLRGLGVRISLDDFGAGYSSLGYLRSFPFDKIKIDRSFINELSESADCRAIVRAIAELAVGLRMVTTAEGVESLDQLERLRAEGCTEAQGYFFSRPMPSDEIRAFLAEHSRLFGLKPEKWSSFRALLTEAGLEQAARDFADNPADRRRVAAR